MAGGIVLIGGLTALAIKLFGWFGFTAIIPRFRNKGSKTPKTPKTPGTPSDPSNPDNSDSGKTKAPKMKLTEVPERTP